jgi:hypothetical protein
MLASRACSLPGSELSEPSSTVQRGQLDDTEREIAQGLLVPILWKEHLPKSGPPREGRAFHLLKSTAMATAST